MPATIEDLIHALVRAPEDLGGARRVARAFGALDDGDVDALLWNEPYRPRLVAVLLLVQRFREGSEAERRDVLERYLAAARGERIDTRELVDVSAEHIVGAWYLDHGTGPVFALAKSDIVWERRIALLATMAWVKRGDAGTPLDVAGRLVRENSEDIQTALGLVLREVGKRADERALRGFLDDNAARMGATALRIATEHLG
jgi:3-methyladenine DNA glycosylase AlkD